MAERESKAGTELLSRHPANPAGTEVAHGEVVLNLDSLTADTVDAHVETFRSFLTSAAVDPRLTVRNELRHCEAVLGESLTSLREAHSVHEARQAGARVLGITQYIRKLNQFLLDPA